MPAENHVPGDHTQADTSLSAAQVAGGRSRLYAILARLAAEPASPDLIAQLAAWPDLADKPRPAPTLHQWLLEFQLHPYAGVFLHPRGLLGDPLHHNLGSFYAAAGHQPTLHRGGPDHLANLLDVLAHLCAATGDAWRDQLPTVARRIELLQATLLSHFLLPWLPPFANALRQIAPRQPDIAFYQAWLDLLLTALDNHLPTLPSAPAPVDDNAEPTPPDLVEADTRALAAWFTIPRRAGLYLAPVQLQQWGQELQVAPGFGNRARQLETLFQTVPHAEWPQLIAAVRGWLQTGAQDYRTLATEFPALSPSIIPWQQRVERTSALLERMQHSLDQS